MEMEEILWKIGGESIGKLKRRKSDAKFPGLK